MAQKQRIGFQVIRGGLSLTIVVGMIALLTGSLAKAQGASSQDWRSEAPSPQLMGQIENQRRVQISSLVAAKKGGDSGGGGGVSFVCLENGMRHVYLADTYALFHETSILQTYAGTSPEAVLTAALAYFDANYPKRIYQHPFLPGVKVSFAWLLASQRARLQFEPLVSREPFPHLSDDHILKSQVPNGCEKVQLAVQDVSRRTVYEKFDLRESMSRLEQGLFVLHETLISLRDQPGADTTAIRKIVSQFASDAAFEKFAQKILPTSPVRHSVWRQIKDSSYCRKPGAPMASFICGLAAERQGEPDEIVVPTLIELPRSLQCQITAQTYVGPTPLNSHFDLWRTGGTGRPDDHGRNQYRLMSSERHQFISQASTETEFSPHGVQDESDLNSYGDISVFINFARPTNASLKIDHYVGLTREFVGQLEFGSLPQEHFRISCWADQEPEKFEMAH